MKSTPAAASAPHGPARFGGIGDRKVQSGRRRMPLIDRGPATDDGGAHPQADEPISARLRIRFLRGGSPYHRHGPSRRSATSAGRALLRHRSGARAMSHRPGITLLAGAVDDEGRPASTPEVGANLLNRAPTNEDGLTQSRRPGARIDQRPRCSDTTGCALPQPSRRQETPERGRARGTTHHCHYQTARDNVTHPPCGQRSAMDTTSTRLDDVLNGRLAPGPGEYPRGSECDRTVVPDCE
jgi:hypothetical protein